MAYTTDFIKNISIAGHGATGKTTLFERLCFAGGLIEKPETVESGKTVSDYAQEEIERKISIHTALASIVHGGKKINVFDTPGAADFVGDVILTFRASEFAALTVDARTGIQIETIKLWRNLQGRKKPFGVFVTKLDDERADFEAALTDIKEKFKKEPVPVTIPMNKGAYTGVIDVLHEKAYVINENGIEKETDIPNEYKEDFIYARIKLIEAAADGDEILMEKYIILGSLEPSETYAGLAGALKQNKFLPVFATAAIKNSGMIAFLDFMAEIAPSPVGSHDIAISVDGTEKSIAIDSASQLSALVIKTSFDQFSGKLSWLKIISGKMIADSDCTNVCEFKKERTGKLYTCVGKKLQEVKELCAGDIGIITKSATMKTNDTIAATDCGWKFLPLRLPLPVHSVALNASEKKNDDKLGDFLVRAAEADKTFKYDYNSETKERVISGMGELHINMILEKAKSTLKIGVETAVPRVAYRETITKKSKAEYTHKKQTGGHGQYGKVVLEIAPLPRGENYRFVNAICGGAVPKNYIPGVEKGIAEGMSRGIMAGYPAVDIEVKIVDGKYHPVDSSELAFALAARGAFRDAMKTAVPTLLEPIMALTVFAEAAYLGDIMSDISGRRGKIAGQESIGGGIEEIKAQVPHSELLRYSIDLRSITAGTGSFGIEFSHYAPISGRIADEVIKLSALSGEQGGMGND
ncbi:MAG: elongation factor G [Termitinemataceae bacterium]|nr:MAG: elongation factor G [Termitinemataceae bacterium]